jgi:hypothetical protein
MRYVTQKNNRYYYQRGYPTRVLNKAPARYFTMVLSAGVDDSELELAKAVAVASEAFDIEVRRLDNSDAQSASDEAIDALAAKALRKLKMNDLDLSSIKLSGWSPEGHEMSAEQVVEHFIEAALEEVLGKLPSDNATQIAVRDRVAERLTKRSSQIPKRLSQLWKPYCSFRDVQQDDSKRYKQKLSNFERALSFIGDHPLVHSTDKEINRGHRELVQSLLDRGVKPESAKKAITMSLACFRWAANEYDLDWNIKAVTPKAAGKAKSTMRKTASKSQMIEIAQACVKADDHIGAMGILALHGLLPTEIARIEDPATLTTKIPHILLPEGKTIQRKRAVVICFALDVVRRHIVEAIDYCKSKGDSEGGSATFNKRLRLMYPGEDRVSWYGLRHGTRNLWVMSNANTSLMNAFLGWAGAEGGGMHLHYGAEGIDESDFLKALKTAGYGAYKDIRSALK